MKFFLTIFFSFIFFAVADANVISEKIKIGSNAKTSKLEIRYNTKSKKNKTAKVFITDVRGKEVCNFTCAIKKGSNAVCMQDALDLTEGIYTVKMVVGNKISSTKLVLFN